MALTGRVWHGCLSGQGATWRMAAVEGRAVVLRASDSQKMSVEKQDPLLHDHVGIGLTCK